jgi:hypothetical protein
MPAGSVSEVMAATAGPGTAARRQEGLIILAAVLQAGDHRLLHADGPRQLSLGEAALRPVADYAHGQFTCEDRPVSRLPEVRVLMPAVDDLPQGRQLAALHQLSTSSTRASAAATARPPRGRNLRSRSASRTALECGYPSPSP